MSKHTIASHKMYKTEQVLLDLSDDEYFEKVDSDHQVNEREQYYETDRDACNTQHKTYSVIAYK